MSPSLTSQEREEIRVLLRRVFKEEEAEVLLGVLERIAAHRDEVIIRQDIHRLETMIVEGQQALQAALARLVEAQARTDEHFRELAASQIRLEERFGELSTAQARLDEHFGELAVAQARLDERMEQLVAAQARTEGRLDRVEAALARLAEAQARTDESLERLAEAQARTEKAVDRLARQVGGLSETVGGDIEDIAYIVIHDVLGREFGWKVGVLERSWQRWDGKLEEINLFGQAKDPAHPERTIWIVGEAKHNLTRREVERFARLVERARQQLVGDVFPVCFCYRARPEVQERLQELGIRLVFSYGRMK